MTLSVKKIYHQQGITSPVISIRRQHQMHFKPPTSIKKAQAVFSSKNSGNGFDCGCRKNNSLQAGIDILIYKKEKGIGEVVPSWVSAVRRDSRTGAKTRTITGVLTQSRISGEDFPLKPWHFNYDWNYFVKTDKQFFYLNSRANRSYNEKNQTSIMECEWDTAFVPLWSLPMPGDRVQITGRWIYDCGHPVKGKHRSEIHPPKAVISFREETDQFAGNAGRSRASQAVVYINGKGGYINQKINDQNYSFDIYLPPKPSSSSVPKFKVKKMINRIFNPFPSSFINPIVTPFPKENPKLLRVTIPLKGQNIPSKKYGVIISGGWSDPAGLDAKDIKKITVNITNAVFKKDKDPNLGPINRKDEWYLYTGINGRWKLFKSMDKGKRKLNHKVVLHLHKTQTIKISANGYEADPIHDILGASVGLASKVTSSPRLTSQDRKKAGEGIKKGFLKLGTDILEGESIENDKIGIVDEAFSSNKKFKNRLLHAKLEGKISKDYHIEVDIT